MAPHSSTLAWKIPWTEEPGRLQSLGSWRVRHDWATSLSLSCIGEGNGNPLQCSGLENPRDGGAWWAAVYGVTQSRTRLKRLNWNEHQTMRYYSALKRNELSRHEKTRKILKGILWSGENQSEKATCCVIPTVWHSGEGKIMETVKRPVVPRGGGRRNHE